MSIRSQRHAFTLIELLVVVAVIVVLISILLPTLSAAKQQAKIASCGSAMRQAAMAVIMYTSEYGDTFPAPSPSTSSTPPVSATAVDWWRSIGPELGSSLSPSQLTDTDPQLSKQLRCPVQWDEVHMFSTINAGNASKPTFAMNRCLGPNSQWGYWKKMPRLQSPATTIMLSEAGIHSVLGSIQALDTYWLKQSAIDPSGVYRGGAHHEGRATKGVNNIAWCDGHVSTYADVAVLCTTPYSETGLALDVWDLGIPFYQQ